MSNQVALRIAQAVLAIVLMASVYLSAATASITDRYQPGIARLRHRLDPLVGLSYSLASLWLLACSGLLGGESRINGRASSRRRRSSLLYCRAPGL